MNKFNRVILYCRSGFEKECAAEITDKANNLNILGYAKTKSNTAFVEYECYDPSDAEKLIKTIDFKTLIFSRQIFVATFLPDLPIENRIDPIITVLNGKISNAGDLKVEHTDTNEGKELSTFCRKFTIPLRTSLRNKKILSKIEKTNKKNIHLLFINSKTCFIGYSLTQNCSPFYMGIPRLKFPNNAPSRSTLKLEEAFHVFIPYEEWEERLKGGLHAVDLGAAPGGWTYQLVKHNMMVYAIDNGAMNKDLMETGQVKHFKEDGFKFKPKKNNIYWLVCDMVEKPLKVTELICDWLTNARCREAIFNLKLPMKKRYEEVINCIEFLIEQLKQNHINFQLQIKQLYHDREEVTVHVQRIWGKI